MRYDVCAVLGLANPSEALSRLGDDEKGLATETLGGRQEMNVITEFGLYRLILRSNKPKAKAFPRSRRRFYPPSAKLAGTKQDNKSHSRK